MFIHKAGGAHGTAVKKNNYDSNNGTSQPLDFDKRFTMEVFKQRKNKPPQVTGSGSG